MLQFGHTIDRVGKGYNIAILHAFLRGIGFQFYLGLLCSTVPVIRICTDGDQFFHFCTAETRISLELGLIKNLRRIRSLGVRTIYCVLDLSAIGIREQPVSENSAMYCVTVKVPGVSG